MYAPIASGNDRSIAQADTLRITPRSEYGLGTGSATTGG